MAIEWSSKGNPSPVFLSAFATSMIATHADWVFLFGVRYDLAEVLVGGQSLGSGHFIEFIVAFRDSDGEWKIQRLLQRQSVTFSATDEAHDYVAAASIDQPHRLSVKRSPRWKESDAVWPTDGGGPMIFIGQVVLPETELTRVLFTWGMNVYLFRSNRTSIGSVKVVIQEIEAQTAEGHYEEEE
jgi:hypothetical protein